MHGSEPGPASLLAAAVLTAGCGSSAIAESGEASAPQRVGARAEDTPEPTPLALVVYTRTAGFRHASIAAGRSALRAMAAARTWRATFTEESAELVATLPNVDVVVFLNTSGDVLADGEQAAFEAWVRGGGGFVGIHAAADTEYAWPFYGELIGTWFRGHAAVQEATIRVEDRAHPSTEHLSGTWTRVDEWYDFLASPRAGAAVLLTVDESSYEGGAMGPDHPLAWTRAIDDGRSFYTALGHTEDSYEEPAFLEHVAGGIEWASGR